VPAHLVVAFSGSLAQALVSGGDGSGGGSECKGSSGDGDGGSGDVRALLAAALALPSVGELSDAQAAAQRPVDPLVLAAARRHVKAQLAASARGLLERVYAHTAPRPVTDGADGFSTSGAEVGRRALRNLCLDFLAAADAATEVAAGNADRGKADRGGALAFAQYSAATCMTDRLAALHALVDHCAPGNTHRERALAAFKADAGRDALVVNKWFSAQASAASAAEVAASLLAHPDFSWSNPNRLRSVVAVFAGNAEGFHAADGAGYALLADAVLRVDSFNPQIAARLCGTLSLWRRYGTNTPRGQAMRASSSASLPPRRPSARTCSRSRRAPSRT